MPGTAKVRLDRGWEGDLCRSRVDVPHGLPPQTGLYGEGFQMLSQTGGTLGAPADLGNYTDPRHYKLPEPAGALNWDDTPRTLLFSLPGPHRIQELWTGETRGRVFLCTPA